MPIAVTEAITTLTEAERRFHLHRTEDDQFFLEWLTGLGSLADNEKASLN